MLLLPEFAYTRMLLSENGFFPAFVLALFAIASALERPLCPRQVGALAAISLACVARQQGFVLLAVLHGDRTSSRSRSRRVEANTGWPPSRAGAARTRSRWPPSRWARPRTPRPA
jgi:hypothetical protein